MNQMQEEFEKALKQFIEKVQCQPELKDSTEDNVYWIQQQFSHLYHKYHPIDCKNLLHDLTVMYQEVEAYLNNTHTALSCVVIPSINELRYAGHHMTKAIHMLLNNEDDYNIRGQIISAICHVKRAKYDCMDVELMVSYSGLNAFLETHGSCLTDSQHEVISKLGARKLVDQIKKHFVQLDMSREANYLEREKYYADLEDKLPEIKKISEKLGDEEAILLSIYEREASNNKKEIIHRNLGYIVGVLGLIIGVIGAL